VSLKQPIRLQRAFSLADAVVLLGLAALVFGVVAGARRWTGEFEAETRISLSAWALPGYALRSLMRGFAAYLLSLAFTLIYGRVAAYNRRAEQVMIPLLDILQSIPVLGFLPGLVLALIALFPHSNLGLELACVLMIFTGQVWNMTFSFYHSLQSIPQDLREAARLYRFTPWQRFTQMEIPFAAIGLVWNSMMSMAGGWFFLTVAEAFVLGEKNFRLPGVGAYMSKAIAEGNAPAMILGVLAMMAMIVAVDLLFWRPLVAWSQKFKMEQTEGGEAPTSGIYEFVRRSRLLRSLELRAAHPFARQNLARAARGRQGNGWRASPINPLGVETAKRIFGWLLAILIWAGVGFGVGKLIVLLAELRGDDWLRVAQLTGLTFLRVTAAVSLGSLVMIPLGVTLGLNPRLAQRLQPVTQLVASFPAPMLYPLALGAMHALGVTLNFGAVVLMLLGTQWYILFNVIAGAMAIPSDMREAAAIYRLGSWEKWRRLILPAIFPSLVTGWVTAMGGAWNASIVAEYVHYGDRTEQAAGLGAAISQATDSANYPMLAACVLAMCVTVVAFNRVVWKRVYQVAEQKYSLNK
jgi:NitT/TauT family transport system permease protein